MDYTPRKSQDVSPRLAIQRAPVLDTTDKYFTLFQISGLLALLSAKYNRPYILQEQFNIDPTQKEWASKKVSYLEMRHIFEHTWLDQRIDRSQSLFAHAAHINYRSFGAISLASMTLGSCENSLLFCAKNFLTPWSAVPELNRQGSISLLHIPKFYDPELRATLEHFHFVNCFAVSRSHTPGGPIAHRVRFTRSCGISKTTLERFFGCPVYFGEGIAQIDFTRQWLNQATPALDAELAPVAGQHARRILAQGPPKTLSLFQLFKANLATIHSADDMAQMLGVSRRTLTRTLARQGASYSILSREVRLTEACRMLRNGETTALIAEHLGFSDERSFRRAFRSWSGDSPAEYRRGQRHFLQPLVQ